MPKLQSKSIVLSHKSGCLIRWCGEMWARNTANISSIPPSSQGGKGVYILYDGSMPVYIGKGNIRLRIRQHRRSKRLGQLWEHFSWYVPCDSAIIHDIEALLLRMLPSYLRFLTRQRGKFLGSKPQTQQDSVAELINRKLPSHNSRRRKRHR